MNIKKIWIMLIIALVSICTVSCGGDDDDDNNSPNSTTVVPDPEGTLEIFLNTGTDPYYYSSKHTSIDLGWVSLGLRATQYLLALDTSNNIAIWDHRKKTEKKMIVSVGKVNGLGNIVSVPNSGWTTQALVKEENGYIVHFDVEGSYNGEEYIRLYIKQCQYDASGNITGAYVKYQRNWSPDDK